MPVWILYALASMFFAGLTSVIAKFGLKNVPSDLGLAIRTSVVFIFIWINAIAFKHTKFIGNFTGKDLLFLSISALTTSLVEHSDKMTNSLHSIGTEVAMSLAQTGADVTESISQRASEVNQTFKHTGDNLILDLGLRGSEITQKLDETGRQSAS